MTALLLLRRHTAVEATAVEVVAASATNAVRPATWHVAAPLAEILATEADEGGQTLEAATTAAVSDTCRVIALRLVAPAVATQMQADNDATTATSLATSAASAPSLRQRAAT